LRFVHLKLDYDIQKDFFCFSKLLEWRFQSIVSTPFGNFEKFLEISFSKVQSLGFITMFSKYGVIQKNSLYYFENFSFLEYDLYLIWIFLICSTKIHGNRKFSEKIENFIINIRHVISSLKNKNKNFTHE